MYSPRAKSHLLITCQCKKNITKENQQEIAFLKEQDPIPTSMLVMNNIKEWLKMSKVTIATVERERLSIPEKMERKADQQVLRAKLEARFLVINKMILKVFLASKT